MLDRPETTEQEALDFHQMGRPGKLEIVPTKPMTTQRDLSLAYSPGVASPCLEIARDPSLAYAYTTKGNMVAVISNGTAVLGLGNLGALASKPVMEGKSVLFKKFADVDSIDLEVSTENVDEFVNCVKYLGASFGGINLEDIKAPECFVIEERLKACMDIPIFHDDQHGTAIIAAAGLINSFSLTGRSFDTAKVVVNGAGAAAVACADLIVSFGIRKENLIMCDTKGVIFKGRKEGMNEWKERHASNTDKRTLAEALMGADVFLGLSVKGAINGEMIMGMAKSPIIFAMANPDPEITPAEAKKARPDAIVATGRSDYPNQVNNVLGFPYIFRGALDVRAREINMAMKIAAAEAIAALAREDVPDEVRNAYSGRKLKYGPDYIIPVPFDPRLIVAVPSAVAEAAVKSGVSQIDIPDFDVYRQELKGRLDPTSNTLQHIFDSLQAEPKKIIFAEGEDIRAIKAALSFQDQGYGQAILIGRDEQIQEIMRLAGLEGFESLEIQNAKKSTLNQKLIDLLYEKHQRQGLMYRDCQRLVNSDRHYFASLLLEVGEADAMIAGLTRGFKTTYHKVMRVIGQKSGQLIFGLSIVLSKGHTLFIADTTVNETPSAELLAEIAIQTVEKALLMEHAPRVAFVSSSNFGQGQGQQYQVLRDAIKILESKKVDFEFDGEMTVDVALDDNLRKRLYPFSKLTGPANILIMPNLEAANIASKLLANAAGSSLIGPLMMGTDKPVQIVPMGASVSDLVTSAAIACYDAF